MFSALEGLKTQTTPFFAKKTQKKQQISGLAFYEENLYGDFTITTWDKPLLWAPILG